MISLRQVNEFGHDFLAKYGLEFLTVNEDSPYYQTVTWRNEWVKFGLYYENKEIDFLIYLTSNEIVSDVEFRRSAGSLTDWLHLVSAGRAANLAWYAQNTDPRHYQKRLKQVRGNGSYNRRLERLPAALQEVEFYWGEALLGRGDLAEVVKRGGPR